MGCNGGLLVLTAVRPKDDGKRSHNTPKTLQLRGQHSCECFVSGSPSPTLLSHYHQQMEQHLPLTLHSRNWRKNQHFGLQDYEIQGSRLMGNSIRADILQQQCPALCRVLNRLCFTAASVCFRTFATAPRHPMRADIDHMRQDADKTQPS